MTKYLFDGDVIKLTAQDFHKASKLYPKLDLTKELEQLDVELKGTKKWWPVMHAKLNYRNRVAQKNKRTDLQEDLNDRSWASPNTLPDNR